MAFNSAILFTTKPSIGGLYFDAMLRERHNYPSRITSHPIEAGANIVDNQVIFPPVIEMEIAVGSVYLANPFLSFGGSTRPVDALAQLRQLQATRQPMTVVCLLAVYQNVLIKEINAHIEKDTASTLIATVTMWVANIVDSNGTSINVSPANPAYANPVNTGTKQAQPV